MSIAIAQLRGQNFRHFPAFALDAHPRVNVVLGENAAGKTTLLESIYCLGRAKSFRSTQMQDLCGPVHRHWSVFGSVLSDHAPIMRHTVQWQSGLMSVRIDEKPAPVSELVKALPIQILDPTAHRLLQEGPAYRRAFLDWGVFHVEHGFYSHWRRFQRALRQRNFALRTQQSDRVINAWNDDLGETASLLDGYRRNHLNSIKPIFSRIAPLLMIDDSVELELRSGWDSSRNYADVLNQQWENDRRASTTQSGPQRAELVVKVLNRQAKSGISRGQQKLLIAALLISQCLLIQELTSRAPVLLVDDFSSELSDRYQRALLAQLSAYPGQSFISSFTSLPMDPMANDCRMFHVEHGKLSVSDC